MENEVSSQDPVIPESTIEKPSFAGIFDDEQELTGNQDWVAVPSNLPLMLLKSSCQTKSLSSRKSLIKKCS